MTLPDFTSPTLFPPFTSLPLSSLPLTATATPPTTTTPKDQQEHYLLAQITSNMTLTKPTLILADRFQTSFALVYDSRSGAGVGPDALDLSRLGLKRGATVVVRGAVRRLSRKEQEQEETQGQGQGQGQEGHGHVAISREEEECVRVIPGPLERVMKVGMWLRERDVESEGHGEEGGEQRSCETCGERKGSLMRCTGCGEVEYCSKECQVKGWNEGGHKADCKIIKGIRAIWP